MILIKLKLQKSTKYDNYVIFLNNYIKHLVYFVVCT